MNTLTRRGIVILVSSFLGRDGPTSLRMIVVTILIQIYKKKTQNNIFRNNTISFCPSRPTLLVSAQPCWPWLCQSHATLRSCCRGRSPPSSRVPPWSGWTPTGLHTISVVSGRESSKKNVCSEVNAIGVLRRSPTEEPASVSMNMTDVMARAGSRVSVWKDVSGYALLWGGQTLSQRPRITGWPPLE